MSIQCFEGTSANYPVNTYQYGLLYVTHGINNNVIQQIYIPHHNNIPYESVSIAHRMKYDDKQNFYAWIYAYETDYKQISLKSIGYIYFNNGLIFQWAQKNLNTSAYNNSFSSWIYPIAFPENGYAGDHVFPWGVWGTNTEEPFQTRIPVFIFPHAHISFTKMDFDFTLFQVNSSGVTSLSATGLNTKIYVIGF